MELRRTFAILVLLVASLFTLAGWTVFYHNPRVYAEVHEQGIDAGRDGIPVEACPYGDYEKRHSWLRGWMDGYRQRNHQ